MNTTREPQEMTAYRAALAARILCELQVEERRSAEDEAEYRYTHSNDPAAADRLWTNFGFARTSRRLATTNLEMAKTIERLAWESMTDGEKAAFAASLTAAVTA